MPFIIEKILQDVEKHSKILSLNNGSIQDVPEPKAAGMGLLKFPCTLSLKNITGL